MSFLNIWLGVMLASVAGRSIRGGTAPAKCENGARGPATLDEPRQAGKRGSRRIGSIFQKCRRACELRPPCSEMARRLLAPTLGCLHAPQLARVAGGGGRLRRRCPASRPLPRAASAALRHRLLLPPCR